MRGWVAGAVGAFAGLGAPLGAQGPAKPPELVVTPVLDHPIAKGDLLATGDFTTKDLPAGQASSAPRLADIVGMEAAHALQRGTIVRSSDVIRPQLVRRGEPVTIALRSGGLSITTAGRALGSGAAGEFVRIVSLSTNRTLDGVVEASGLVRVATN